jgi:soluble cytochrome b562
MTVLGIALAGAFLVPAAYGVDEHHPEKAGPAAKAAKAPAKPKAGDKTAAQMHDHMKKMQDLMARLQKTTDPAERKKLMDEHTKAMQEGMQTMRGMGGGMMQGMEGGMMGQAPKDGAAKPGMGRGAPMSPEMMERRMDMMQMMMEQMMQHQKALEGSPK